MNRPYQDYQWVKYNSDLRIKTYPMSLALSTRNPAFDLTMGETLAPTAPVTQLNTIFLLHPSTSFGYHTCSLRHSLLLHGHAEVSLTASSRDTE